MRPRAPSLLCFTSNKQSEPLYVIRQVVRLPRPAVSILLVPLADGANDRITLFEAERDLQ